MRILIAEDDPVTLDSVDASLRGEGFTTVLARNGKEAVELWEKEKPDIACLDIMMPELDGYEVCRRIRAADPRLPILFLSAKNEEIDVVVGLELGADDFVRKPFGKRELLARIRSVIRRTEQSSRNGDRQGPALFHLGKGVDERLAIYPTQLRAVRESTGEEFDLSPREVSILNVLHDRAGEAVSRDELLDRCWGLDYFPESRTLDQHIAKLRRRIETNPAVPTIIETIRGVGYRTGRA